MLFGHGIDRPQTQDRRRRKVTSVCLKDLLELIAQWHPTSQECMIARSAITRRQLEVRRPMNKANPTFYKLTKGPDDDLDETPDSAEGTVGE